MREILKQAQDKFGYATQITVVTEELCELAAILSKYPRYPNHELASEKIRSKVVEEVADVVICLEHVSMIFNISPEELHKVKQAKLGRLERWLEADNGMYQTTIDRDWSKGEK